LEGVLAVEKITNLTKILDKFEPLPVILAYCGAVALATGKDEIGRKLVRLAESKNVEPVIVSTNKIHFVVMGKNHISIYTDKYLIEVDLNTGKVKHFTA